MADESLLWYDQPASEWNEALPIGNGRLGCMVHGRTGTEFLCLNEDSVWFGGPQDRLPKDALKNLPKLRELVRQGQHKEAEKLCQRAFCATPSAQRHYEPLGNVKLDFDHDSEKVTNYRRELDLDTAIHKTEYSYDGTQVKIEMLASFPDQVLAMRIQTSSSIEFVIRMSRLSEKEYESQEYMDSIETADKRICMFVTPGGYGSVRACCSLGVDTDAEGSVEVIGGSLIVNAKDALIVIAARTTYRYEDFATFARSDVSTALKRGADRIWQDHVRDYQSLYTQMHLSLGPSSPDDSLSTNQRIQKPATPSLITLYTNYSRYLLVSSSRTTANSYDLPANLQGLWNPSFSPAWGSRFTININLQMNYWPCLPSNLHSCMEPVFALLHAMAAPDKGQRTAKEMYGARGWCCHNNTDLWADTDIAERWMPSTLWPLGGAWMSSFIWEHYLFTLDRNILERDFPILKGAVEFCLDWLVEEEFEGKEYKVTNPSLSPENTFIDDNGNKGVFCRGSTADMTIISSLFEDFLRASRVLSHRSPLVNEVGKAMLSLPPPAICPQTGRLQEWGLSNYADAEPGHRHVSHLLGLFPYSSIDMDATPSLAKAAIKSLELRLQNGGGHTGWSRAHLLCLYTRLRDPNAVQEQLGKLVQHSTLPNLLDTHPPFQIDGNFGGAAGVLEALVQSHEFARGRRLVRLLPACPAAWSEGQVKGVRVRGGWTLSFAWKDGEVSGVVKLRDAAHCDDEGERKGILMFPDGKFVCFEGKGPHRIHVS